MNYHLESSNSSGGGDIPLIKIKIKCPAGQNLEIMTFKYFKTFFLKKFFLKITTLFVSIFQEYYL